MLWMADFMEVDELTYDKPLLVTMDLSFERKIEHWTYHLCTELLTAGQQVEVF